MYQPQPPLNNNKNDKTHTYYPQHSVSPPPLQHPIPTHPPFQMRDPPASPSPPAQHQHQQHQQHPQQSTHILPSGLNNDWLNDPTTQMGVQFGRNAMMAGSEYVEKNPWSRLIIRSERNGQMEGYRPPREDINSPDLYIPAMAFVTYVLLTGIVAGTKHKFHPEVLGINATTGLLLVIFELLFIKIGCYLLNITSEAQFLDFLSYSGYKFIGVIITILVSLVAPFWLVLGTFSYAACANGFFLLRSLRYVVFPDSTNTVQVPQRKRRIHFLFVVSALQTLFMYYLIHNT